MNARLQVAPLVGHLAIDETYDRTYASDGFSRFGAYLAMRLPAVLDDDPDVLLDPVRWAAFAWATATAPVMSPGYLSWHGPIEDIGVGWDDGHLAFEAVLWADPPVSLPGWRGWDRDRHGDHVEPWYATRTALTRITLRAVLIDLELPAPPGEVSPRQELVSTAKTAVTTVALAVRSALAPAVAALDVRMQGADR
jgi:hypothetical protein